MHGPVPVMQRELTKDFDLDGVTIPPGCTIEVPIYCVHHNPAIWGDDHMVRYEYSFNDYFKARFIVAFNIYTVYMLNVSSASVA